MTTGTKRAQSRKSRVERRHCTRFDLRGKAWFEWESTDGEKQEAQGVTRNVGRAGTFIEAVVVPPIDSPVKVIITLAGCTNDEMRARLRGLGNVRHVCRSGPNRGFGVSIMFHTEAPEEPDERTFENV